MIDAINRFRWQHGVGSVKHRDSVVDGYCEMHCLAMSRVHGICHAPECYLEGWSEAVALMQYCDDWKDRVIFDVIGTSDQGHKDLLLNSDTISCASHIDNWIVYVTVRGKKD